MPLDVTAIYPASDPQFIAFPSRRSVVHSTKGIVSCSQPLAAEAGHRILRNGGNAADAAIATAAALNMTEPMSTGIGGDMFLLFYDHKTKHIQSLNGSGRSTGTLSLEQLVDKIGSKPPDASIPLRSALTVTTPGAAAGWVDTIEKFGSGKVSLEDVLLPAIELGEEGFPVSELAAFLWKENEKTLRRGSTNFGEMLRSDRQAPDGKRPPRAGEIFKNPELANTFRLLGRHGKSGFYSGAISQAIADVIKAEGGSLNTEDLELHQRYSSELTMPICLTFGGQNLSDVASEGLDGQVEGNSKPSGIKIWEHPPNGQGLVALIALGILEQLENTGKIPTFTADEHNSAEYLHALIESLKIAFADGSWFIADPDIVQIPVTEILSKAYLAERAKLFTPRKASTNLSHGNPANCHGDTVYFAVTDAEGNACSFINSVYTPFGTGIIPKGCGFTLQNRGAGFSLNPNHPNVYAPGKRPYHTIIPAMITNADDDSLHTVYGVMGGFMQPQGHVQVLLNMTAFKYHPQAALDAPRFCIGAGMPDQGDVMDHVFLEEGISEEVAAQLREWGHDVTVMSGFQRGMFGRGQVIRCHMDEGQLVYSAGSDPRGDGCAFPL